MGIDNKNILQIKNGTKTFSRWFSTNFYFPVDCDLCY